MAVQNALELLDQFQLSISDVEAEVRTLVGNTLALLSQTNTMEEIAKCGGDKIERHPQILLGLLKRQRAAWWALPADSIRGAGRHEVWGTLRTEFEAWAGVSEFSCEQIVAIIECTKPKLPALKILAGVRHWGITSDDLISDATTAMAYVQNLLQKPRTVFLPAVEIFVHFGLADDAKALRRFETEALKALATLVKSDRQVLEEALRTLLREPSLTRPPCDWTAAVDGIERGDRGPLAWPSWTATMAPKIPLKELVLSVPLRFVSDASELCEALDAITSAGRVAIDAEWARDSPHAAIIQLAIDSMVYVWDLQVLPQGHAADAMDRVFANPSIRKLGFGFSQSDWPRLSRWLSNARGVVDIDKLWLHLHPDEPLLGLKRLVAKVLGCQMDKTQQCSDWATRPLSQRQLEYAALDAHVLLQVWDLMSPPESAIAAISVDLLRPGLDSGSVAESKQCMQVAHLKDLASLDIRVGVVLATTPVPGTRQLSVCSVDLGSLGRRQVVQGCEVVPSQRVLVLCNIAPAEIHTIWSQAGLLVAYFDDGRRIPASPPASAPIGTSLLSVTSSSPPVDVIAPHNAWFKCRERLAISANGSLHFDESVLQIGGEACKVVGGHGGTFQ
jgi:tRNA-binding EMAP/Myf-like protein